MKTGTLLLGWTLVDPAMADVQVTTHLVEIPQTRLSEVLALPPAAGDLRDRIREEMKTGGARTADVSSLRLPLGSQALLQSISEVIYPVDPEPSSGPGPHAMPAGPRPKGPPMRMPVGVSSFATRSTGATLQVDVTRFRWGAVEVRLNWNWTTYPSDTVFADWTDGRTRYIERKPAFVNLRAESQFVFTPGKWQLAGTFSPHDAAGKIDFSRKLLLFVRADEVR